MLAQYVSQLVLERGVPYQLALFRKATIDFAIWIKCEFYCYGWVPVLAVYQ